MRRIGAQLAWTSLLAGVFAGISSAEVWSNQTSGIGFFGFCIAGVFVVIAIAVWLKFLRQLDQDEARQQQSKTVAPVANQVAVEVAAAPIPIASPRPKPTSDSPKSSSDAKPRIVTRTGPNTSGTPLVDPYDGTERAFTAAEDEQLLALLAQSNFNVASIANAMNIDAKQIVARAVRLVLNPDYPIDDVENAPQDGQRYERGERAEIIASFERGESIEFIAREHGRTILAIGWILIDRTNQALVSRDLKDVD